MDPKTTDFGSSTFNPDKYIKELCQKCVDGTELQRERSRIQHIADETNNLLKKNVYINYELFIDTSKEISRLEGDMYQLSHLLSEGKSLISTLTPMLDHGVNILSNETHSLQNKDTEEDDVTQEMKRKRALSDIAEKVEGCINLTENSGRHLLYEGDLEELDSLHNSRIKKLHCYLLSDVVLLTTTITNRRTPACYKLETVYDLTNLAVVNVKDIKNAFKLLAFPDTRVFEAFNSQAKKEWLEKFEEAKRIYLSGQTRKRSSICEQISPIRTNSIEMSNDALMEDAEDSEVREEIPEWLFEVIEELDVLVVERHFENAYALIDKTRTYLKETPPSDIILVQDISGKLDARIKALTDVLVKELEITPNKSHQGGLRAARRAVRLLNTLNKSTQACDLFLKLCSSLLKFQLKRVKRDAATSIYVKQLSAVFFSNICNMAKEFQFHCFPNNSSCTSAFVVWCIHEINHFMNQIITQVFIPQNPLPVIAECVDALHTYGNQLTDLGIDMIYQIDGQLRTSITRALLAARDKMMESIKLNSAEDMWHPMNLKTKQQREKLINEFSSIGLTGLEKYRIADCFLELTNNTVTFCRSYIDFMNNCLAVAIPNIIDDVEQVLCDVLLAFTRHINSSLSNAKFESKKITIKGNIAFLSDKFFPYCQEIFEKHIEMESNKFSQLRNNFKESTAVSAATITGYI